MKKLTSLFAVSVIAMGAVTAANANIASKLYVDQTAASEAGSALTTAKSYTDTRETQIRTDFAAADTALQNKIGTVADNSNLAQMIADEVSARTTGDSTINTFIGTLPATATATTIVGYIDEKAGAASSSAVNGLNLNNVGAETGQYVAVVGQKNGQLSATAKDLVTDVNVGTTLGDKAQLAPTASAVQAAITEADNRAKGAEKAIEDTIGNTAMGTTATTLTGAIAEVKTATTNLGSDKMNLVEGATVTNLATYGANGQVVNTTITDSDVDGVYVLTAKKNGTNVTYYWENIQRGTGEGATGGEPQGE